MSHTAIQVDKCSGRQILMSVKTARPTDNAAALAEPRLTSHLIRPQLQA